MRRGHEHGGHPAVALGKGWSLTRDHLEGLAYPGGDPSCSWAWWLIRRAWHRGAWWQGACHVDL